MAAKLGLFTVVACGGMLDNGNVLAITWCLETQTDKRRTQEATACVPLYNIYTIYIYTIYDGANTPLLMLVPTN